ncbi:hypothetical protein NDU88_002178 [Pleurodeles waltl]|uniref:Uncharacterized protein n=1 Tax=Pleurodeles waltl TaxID=8319 RepID=A0AAV7UAB3_PLEWA|nr:hypothetical protein NDU88_002178 [Pleurodeles waltl]
MRSHRGSLAHCSTTQGPPKPRRRGRGDGCPSQAPEKAPRRWAWTDRVAAACRPQGEWRRGWRFREDLRTRKGGAGPGATDPGEDSLGGGGPGGPLAAGLWLLSVAGPTARRWASGPAGLCPLSFGRARPWVTNTAPGEAEDCLWGRQRVLPAEKSDLPWHGQVRSCGSCGGGVDVEQPNN